jgi:hypothetical protein
LFFRIPQSQLRSDDLPRKLPEVLTAAKNVSGASSRLQSYELQSTIRLHLSRMRIETCRRLINDYWGSLVEILNKIFRKEDIQGPIQRNPQLLFGSGKFEQIDRAPEPALARLQR